MTEQPHLCPPAVSYIRFSSKKQASGASLNRQLEATRAYCEREGLRLDDTVALRDLGVSAWSGANSEYGALSGFLTLVKDGKVERGTRLIVESIDRLSRQAPVDAFQILLGLLRAGVVIVTLMDRQEYDAAALNDGRAHVLLALMQRAHEESQTKSRRVRDALARKKRAVVEERKPASKNCPGWLRLSDDRSQYEPVPDRVTVVVRILEMVRDGVGLDSVAKTLNGEQVPTFRDRTKHWHMSFIRRLVQNRQLIGEYQPHEGTGKDRKPAGDPLKGYYPAVVEKTLFYAAQKAHKSRSYQRGRIGDNVNLFSGLVQEVDGSKWVSVRKGKRCRPQLVCGNARSGVPGYKYQSVALEYFEEGILMFIRDLWKRREAPTSDRGQTVELLLNEIADVQVKIEALRDKIRSTDGAGVSMLIDLVPELESRRATMQAEVERLQAQASAPGPDLPSLIEEMEAAEGDPEKRRHVRLKVRQVIRETVEKVVMLDVKKQSSGRFTHPDTGRRIKPRAGTWVSVAIIMASGEDFLGGMFIPAKTGNFYAFPLVEGQGGIAPELVGKCEVVDVVGDDVVLRVNY